MSASSPLHHHMETCPCVCIPVTLLLVPTLVRMCTCISTCTYVYLTPHICFTPLAYLHGNMGSSVWHCVCVPVTLLLTLVRMHICISTCIYVHLNPSITSNPYAQLHGNMGVPVQHCVCIPVTLILVPHLGKNVYMHQYMYLCLPDSPCCFNPLAQLHGNMGSSVLHCVCVPVTLHLSPHLVRMCTCISTCIHPTSGPTPWLHTQRLL